MYLCTVIKRLLQFAVILSFSPSVKAQFNTVTRVTAKPVFVVQEAVQEDTTATSAVADSTVMEGNTQRQPMKLYMPLDHIDVTSAYGMRRHPITHLRTIHNGIDLAARFEAVYAMLPGEVIKKGKDGKNGIFIVIQSGNFSVSYCHLANTFLAVGDSVEPGQIIAQSGNTGRSTGPHLHLTVRYDGKTIDPTELFRLIEEVNEQV